jgi:hypothetical protein
MYECHGWTDKFQLFQFSFSSVAYSQVSLSVRTEVQTKADGQTQTKKQETQIRSRNTIQWQKKINVTDGTIQEQTCRTINITFSQYAMQCNAMQCNDNAMRHNTMQCNAMQCNTMYVQIRPSVRNESFIRF